VNEAELQELGLDLGQERLHETFELRRAELDPVADRASPSVLSW